MGQKLALIRMRELMAAQNDFAYNKRFSPISTNELYAQTVDGPYELILARISALEDAVEAMRAELAELKADMGDGAIEDIAAALEEDDPYGWIGGTD